MIKKAIQLLTVVAVIFLMASCSDTGSSSDKEFTSSQDSNQVWMADSISITNAQDIFDEQMTAYKAQEEQLQATIDTAQNEQQKQSLEQQLQRMQQQMPDNKEAFGRMISQQLDQRENEITGFSYNNDVLTINKVIRNPQGQDLHFEVRYKLGSPEPQQPPMQQNMQQRPQQ